MLTTTSRPPSSAAASAHRLYVNARVATLAPELSDASAVRVVGERITALYPSTPAADGAEVIDLGGAVVLPGLVDAHFHLLALGAKLRQVDLRGAPSEEDAAARLAERAAHLPRGAWVVGFGWDETRWREPRSPGRASLDRALPHHPVYAVRVDMHAAWVSSAALARAGLQAGCADPPGGAIARSPDGSPSGLLIDTAAELVARVMPQPTPGDLRAGLEAALGACRRAGLTCVHDMTLTPKVLEALRALDAEGALTLRVRGYLHGPWEELEPILRAPPTSSPLLAVRGVKLFCDGALGSRGAALHEPYSDRRDTRGLVLTEPEELARVARRVHQLGYQVAIHAIGDRANDLALDAIAAAQGDERDRRHRIEHVQIVRPRAPARLAELGVVASVQPTHCTSDLSWVEQRLGAERLAGAYAWRSLLDAGARLALGSDAPIESESPWEGIYAAVTRQDRDGEPRGGWYPEQRLTLAEALRGFTVGAAYAAHDDEALGVLRPGAVADLTAVDRDPRELGPAEWLGLRTVRVVVGGRDLTMDP